MAHIVAHASRACSPPSWRSPSLPPAFAQNFAPRATPPPRASAGGAAGDHLQHRLGLVPAPHRVTPGGGFCYCFVPPSTWLPGSARYWPYEGPVSPYLNPHTGPAGHAALSPAV